ncbi:MAG: type ISP restriction/modification enzyme [Candidatus Dojkabacteria bacterium]
METKQTGTQEIFNQYLKDVSIKYADTNTSEYGYRTPFENFLKEIFSEIKVTNIDHDGKAVGGNKPDFVLSKGNVPLLYLEVKDIGVSLDKIEKSEQLARYYGYDNLVLTDYLEFRFYRNGLKYTEPISIASYDKKERTLTYNPENFELLRKTLIQFTESHKEPIKSGTHLAKIMGGKAYRIRENARDMLNSPDKERRSIYKVYETMKRQLIHDMSTDDFADMYAQTLVYGLFVARFHDTSPDTFTRSEARDLVPASNPLLKHFFDHIAGVDFDDKLDSIVDELCRVFSHSDISKLISNYYGTEKGSKDPVIHFYEDFLQEYDSKKRKEFGAYYTPLPVVKFIVNAVDHILEKDFKLAGGLANSSKNEKEHIVQVLDPATGTGTFLTETIKLIHDRRIKQAGNWPSYVLHEVLPRLFGFEIMIAPYTIAHLKMSMLLKETGFKYFNNRRLGIYLTNSLQEGNTIEDMFGGFGLAESISDESKEASKIKKEKPLMVVLGNPPYSGESSNKGKNFEWIDSLLDDYKKEPGGLEKLNERNPKWLNDDYVKFLRFGQHFVEENKTGIVAFINPHGFLDNPTFRGMRWNLLKTYDKIYVLNLHGNAKKKEVCPDGSKDENVFDIQQGVSINILVKTGEKKDDELGQVLYTDIWGVRSKKFEYLTEKDLEGIKWEKIENKAPMYFMVPRDYDLEEEYNKGFRLDELFPVNSVGVVTSRDSFVISEDRDKLIENINNFYNLSDIVLKEKYNLKSRKGFDFEKIKNNTEFQEENIEKISYRPFDERYIYFTDEFIERTRSEVMSNFLNNGENIGLTVCKQFKAGKTYQHVFVSNNIIESSYVSNKTSEITSIFPLYIYDDSHNRIENLNKELIIKIEELLGETKPEELFSYIYAVLHNNVYRERYRPFLKSDFPRIPYPKDRRTFDKLAKLGSELIQYHLLEHEDIDPYQISYLGEGDNVVDKPEYKDGRIYINATQYFGNVSEIAWNFYIGGYQPAQKWLKDRKGEELAPDDIEHYSKIVIVLKETDRIMKEIDKISFR